MLKPVRTVAPAVMPVSLAEAKAHCRVDTADDDALLTGLIGAAVSHLDGYGGILGRAIMAQTWAQDFDGFGTDGLRLPVGDLISVTSIAYHDTANQMQTLANSVYTAFSDERGPFVTLRPDQAWPLTYGRVDAVRVTWVAGFGAAADDVPAAIRHAILMIVGHWYENRETSIVGAPVAPLPLAVDALIAPYRQVYV